jgi:MFS family permease
VHGYFLGMIIVPLEQEFGWPRAEIFAGLFIISMVGLFCSPLAGSLMDRFGSRRCSTSLAAIPI